MSIYSSFELHYNIDVVTEQEKAKEKQRGTQAEPELERSSVAEVMFTCSVPEKMTP